MTTDRVLLTEAFQVTSSNVGLIEYLTFKDAAKNRMRVTFKHGGAYDYIGVPRDTCLMVVNDQSVGSAVHRLIKNVFDFEKVVDDGI